MNKELEPTIIEWERTIEEFYETAGGLGEKEAGEPLSPGKWSAKEIIGHLIDSAANNHQRFVRIQFENNLRLPSYEQMNWVDSQGYAETGWADLLLLWHEYNRHLCRVASRIPAEALGNTVFIGASANQVSLKFLVEDYLDHLQNHLKQILPNQT